MALLTSYIKDFHNVRILCVGDIMLDEFIYGKVERISPEAPVQILKYTNKKKMLGGAGNVVANLRALGCQTSFMAAIGHDSHGETVKQLLGDINIDAHLIELENWPTIMKTRLISGATHLLRIDQEDSLNLNDKDYNTIIATFSELVSDIDVVLLSDYNKGFLNSTVTSQLIEIASQYNRPVIIDPKGTNWEKYRGATIVKPNLKELSQATGLTFDPKSNNFSADITAGAKQIFDKYRIKNLIVTLSEFGMLYVSSDAPDDILQIPTVAKEVFDVSGAGDTSMATLGAAIGALAPIKDAMKLANRASGIVVGKVGTATVSADELHDAVSGSSENDDWAQRRKIITLDQAKRISDQLRSQKRVIGFTNGCFDCCHFGHLHSFMECKKNCDVLFVGMNSDASVKRAKGPTRPIQDEKTRAMLLASLEFIDYVVVFDEDTAETLIDAIQPDIIAKEGYTIDQWPEAQRVIAYGGRAITLPRVDGYSTTNLFNKTQGK